MQEMRVLVATLFAVCAAGLVVAGVRNEPPARIPPAAVHRHVAPKPKPPPVRPPQFVVASFDGAGGPRRQLPFGRGEIVGDRTPCVEGNLSALYPVLARHGFRYDASRIAPLGRWPRHQLGLWSFPLLEIPFVGHTFRVVSMDYNFMANQVGEPPARIENEMYRTLWNAFRASYLGTRAPLSLGNHFETWESWAYDHALTRFLLRACRLPEVRCSSFAELADWLDAQSPRRLARLRAGAFPHARLSR